MNKTIKNLTPLKAIRAKCLDCSAGHPKEVRFCAIPECPLYAYRFGKNPKRTGIGKIKVTLDEKPLLSAGLSS